MKKIIFSSALILIGLFSFPSFAVTTPCDDYGPDSNTVYTAWNKGYDHYVEMCRLNNKFRVSYLDNGAFKRVDTTFDHVNYQYISNNCEIVTISSGKIKYAVKDCKGTVTINKNGKPIYSMKTDTNNYLNALADGIDG